MLLSLATIALIFSMVSHWYGLPAARWAAALMAFNEYYLNVSSRATAHVPYLFLLTLAIYAFARFLHTQRAIYLYGVGASIDDWYITRLTSREIPCRRAANVIAAVASASPSWTG